jgi:ParB-like chromosome segregation protein Spo0J
MDYRAGLLLAQIHTLEVVMKQLQSFLQLTVVYLLLSALRINPHNARTHSKHQIRQIAASIREFGFLNAILIDANNVIIAGHGRAEAAKLLAIELVPTIRVENLTEDQIRAYIVADNRLAEKAGWDKEILAIELQHLIDILIRGRIHWCRDVKDSDIPK